MPGEPAAIATLDLESGDTSDSPQAPERALLIADYHAGYEAGLRYERGVDVPSNAAERRERLFSLIERTNPDHLVVLGDLMHSIGDPGGAERGELEYLFESDPLRSLDVTVVKGNHDGAIETWLDADVNGSAAAEPASASAPPPSPTSLTITPGDGIALGDGSVGVCHGHTWPSLAVLESDVLCLGHEHPCVRVEDEVGGSRVERVWLRGQANPTVFREHPGLDRDALPAWVMDDDVEPPKVVVVPAFNELVGGTWVNVTGQSFLSPFLPDGVCGGEAYLLDGTRLGPYESV
ncbi:metallophosphoesterase [Natrialba magadii ATCC 43099]|uniref:Metallophosphoesterase n=1 Tax=Natrialba magadii (strain ATCC 43099 / DSM 3394 / CCM 3739 / CIP 104546 / IAM 13178 / JCM 8861 / NBRC 102185 / NCIMB 2190 / MS3) TaxID=547559 RepID=L9V6C2_NATMM|nr:metallophosphoesterase [Natrialba magadii]ELY31903.1 metallophosphoesterase [Natrialba magadii ATCC 43099]